jgi:hypothetical protein
MGSPCHFRDTPVSKNGAEAKRYRCHREYGAFCVAGATEIAPSSRRQPFRHFEVPALLKGEQRGVPPLRTRSHRTPGPRPHSDLRIPEGPLLALGILVGEKGAFNRSAPESFGPPYEIRIRTDLEGRAEPETSRTLPPADSEAGPVPRSPSVGTYKGPNRLPSLLAMSPSSRSTQSDSSFRGTRHRSMSRGNDDCRLSG